MRAAADHLHAAGRHARERRDVPAAKNFLERALALAQGGRHAPSSDQRSTSPRS